MVKFVMTQAICPEGIEKLKADTNNDVNIYVADNQDPNNYLDEMQDADALIVRIAKCDAHAIENIYHKRPQRYNGYFKHCKQSGL